MIVFAPGDPVWNVAHTLPWLTLPCIILTAAALALTIILCIACWIKPKGLMSVLGFGLALVLTICCCKGITHVVFVPRPFIADHFTPLFPHAADTSFPSSTVAFFAALIYPMRGSWKRASNWVIGITIEVAIGCVYVGVHYCTDVIVGGILGLVCGLVAWNLLNIAGIQSLIVAFERVLYRLHLRSASWERGSVASSVSQAPSS